ncbi:probable GTPase HflX [Coccomyxa sp. Obi]|nr:probable GTPase HflX [Coccomyxa sp. Obi]
MRSLQRAGAWLTSPPLLGCFCAHARAADLTSLRSFVTEPWRSLLMVHPRAQAPYYVQEALRLAESYAGARCKTIAVGPSRGASPTSAAFFGSGAVESLKAQFEHANPDKVFVNCMLSGVQQRNLEIAWKRPVLDRVGLIIEIFAQRARTREARLQVEMASLDYKASRLVRSLDTATGQRAGFGEGGATEVVSARERGRSGGMSGGLGGSGGGGETELQLQRRRIRTRIKALKRQLAEVRQTRVTQRAGRLRAGKPVCAVVGYTNAGKSSLVSALSGDDVGVQDRLFETLDPMMRQVMLPSGRSAILSDTVGFISDLPPMLIKAFQATLEEVVEADLLLHVIDGSSEQMLAQREAVLAVLRRLGVSEARLQSGVIEVVNKSDVFSSGLSAAALSDERPSDHLLDSSAADEAFDEMETAGSVQEAENGPSMAGSAEAPGGDLAEAQCSAVSESDSCHPQAARTIGSSVEGDGESHSSASEEACLQRPEGIGGVCEWEGTPGRSGPDQSRQVSATLEWVRGRAGRQPSVVVTSAVTGDGLDDLLLEIDKKVSLKFAVRELSEGAIRMGPRVLTENVVGPVVPGVTQERSTNVMRSWG